MFAPPLYALSKHRVQYVCRRPDVGQWLVQAIHFYVGISIRTKLSRYLRPGRMTRCRVRSRIGAGSKNISCNWRIGGLSNPLLEMTIWSSDHPDDETEFPDCYRPSICSDTAVMLRTGASPSGCGPSRKPSLLLLKYPINYDRD